MQTYHADFRTDADYASRTFRARSPQDALKKARAFYDERPEELLFMGYDGGHPVNEIAVRDGNGRQVALWRDDEARLRQAARDLFDAAQLALRELRNFTSDGESEAVRVLSAAIARAKGPATAVRVRTVYGDRHWVDIEDLARARRSARKLIAIRDGTGVRIAEPDGGERSLHIDNIAAVEG